jgi:hypothetical protein
MTRRDVMRGAALATGVAAAAPGAVQFRAFDAAGAPAGAAVLNSLLLTDTDGRAFELLPKVEGPGVVSIPLPDRKFEAMMVLPVRGFGQVFLYADNLPAGESLLNYEFARSRAAAVRRYVESAGAAITKETLARLERGEAALKRAASAADIQAKVGHANDSLSETMWAGEMAVLDRARHNIARRGPRPGFLFGCNGFRFAGSAEYGKRFTDLLNYATMGFYRAGIEAAEGRPDYARLDAVLAKTADTGLLLKGHPLVWFHRSGIPAFLKTKSFDEIRRSCRTYILHSVGRYRARIHAWDVINEAHDWANDLNLDAQQLLDITRAASEATREADPTAFRVINSCCTWAEYVAKRRTYSGPLGRASRTPLDYMRAVEDARIPYEAVGL